MAVITISIFIPDELVGTRVGAFSAYEGDDSPTTPELKMLGYGVYEGLYQLMDDIATEPVVTKEEIVDSYCTYRKPPVARIRLDSGEIIWGSFCYWEEETYVQDLEKRSIVTQLDVSAFQDEVTEGMIQYEDWKDSKNQVNIWDKALFDPLYDADDDGSGEYN